MAIFVNKDVSVTINSVDLSAYVTSCTVDYKVGAVESTNMASGGARTYVGGLQENVVTVNFNQDFAATKVAATLDALIGSTTTIVIKPTSAAVSATNPSYTITGAYCEGTQPVNGAVGDLAAFTWTATGGSLTKATS